MNYHKIILFQTGDDDDRPLDPAKEEIVSVEAEEPSVCLTFNKETVRFNSIFSEALM